VGWLFLLFVVLPLVDLWLLLAIGDALGFWPTVALTLAVAVLGAYLGKREGLKVLRQWRDAMTQLRLPEEGLVSAVLVLAGALLLIAPGVLTDVVGLVLLFPPTRRPIARLVRQRLEGRMQRAVQRGTLQVNVVSFTSASVTSDGHDANDLREVEIIDTVGEAAPDEPKLLPAPRDE
jgi:UPF0716 protein FxsA